MSKPRQQPQVGRAMVYAGGYLVLVVFSSCKISARDHPSLALWGSLALLVGILAFLLVIYFLGRVPEPVIDYGDGNHSVEVDFSSPLNRGVLAYLRSSC
jgi:uncharacterized membrane protein YjfL (UPF0719 family)